MVSYDHNNIQECVLQGDYNGDKVMWEHEGQMAITRYDCSFITNFKKLRRTAIFFFFNVHDGHR